MTRIGILFLGLAGMLGACVMPVSGPSGGDSGEEVPAAVILPAPPPAPRPALPRPSAEEGTYSDEIVEAPVILAEPSIGAAPAPVRGSPAGPRSDVLTAGDIDDGRNLHAFQSYARRARGDTGLPMASLDSAILARLVGADGAPAPHLRVTLRRPGAEQAFWDGYSGVDGAITLFPSTLGTDPGREVEMRVFPADGGEAHVATLMIDGRRDKVILPFSASGGAEFLDLVFAVDTTGSMGDELDWLKYDLASVVQRATAGVSGLSVRYGLVLYRDVGDQYVVRNLGFTGSLAEMQRRIRAQSASGGGDYPEAMEQGLAAALNLGWRRGRGERLLFLIGDAPPHEENAAAFMAQVRRAVDRQVQVFGVAASGVAQEAEFLLRQAAVQTGGRYLFLTDDSGVGGGHAEPTVSCYRVTSFTGLMFRVLRSELTGIRVEAPGGEVLRTVGSYSNGLCRN